MVRYILFLFFSWLLFGVSCTPEGQKGYYIIRKQDSIRASSPVELPAGIFYMYHNFILTADQRVYYHQCKPDGPFCGTGHDFTRPPFINLNTAALLEIKPDSLASFLLRSVNPPKSASDKRGELLIIVSETDTVKNNSFKVLWDYVSENPNLPEFVRRLTEEEFFVLKAKREDKSYNPDSVPWERGFEVPNLYWQRNEERD